MSTAVANRVPILDIGQALASVLTRIFVTAVERIERTRGRGTRGGACRTPRILDLGLRLIVVCVNA